MAKISIIVRTYNESFWIPLLLESLEKQTLSDFELVQVDNYSTDNSVELFQSTSLSSKLVYISEYMPGTALNKGIEVSCGEILVFLSAHCIPNNENWLNNLVSPILNQNFQAVYGRQIPCRSTHPIDIRDLLLTFPNESSVQFKNTFFHNANSAITKKVWSQFPFSEEATNIEDRLFGEQLIKSGLSIFYNADAVVTHQHGLHQTTNIERLRGVTNILEKENIIEYENESFINFKHKVNRVTIETIEITKCFTVNPSITIITNNLNQRNKDVVYIPFNSNDKVLDILRLYAKDVPENYIAFYNWKISSESKINNLISKLKLGNLAICYGKRIVNPILNSGYLNKGLLNSYSRDIKNSSQHELFFNSGLVVHASLLLSSRSNDYIFKFLEVIEE